MRDCEPFCDLERNRVRAFNRSARDHTRPHGGHLASRRHNRNSRYIVLTTTFIYSLIAAGQPDRNRDN